MTNQNSTSQSNTANKQSSSASPSQNSINKGTGQQETTKAGQSNMNAKSPQGTANSSPSAKTGSDNR